MPDHSKYPPGEVPAPGTAVPDEEVNEAEELFEKAARLVIDPAQVEGSEDALHQIHNQLLGMGEPNTDYAVWRDMVIARATELEQKQAMTAATDGPTHDVPSTPEVVVDPTAGLIDEWAEKYNDATWDSNWNDLAKQMAEVTGAPVDWTEARNRVVARAKEMKQSRAEEAAPAEPEATPSTLTPETTPEVTAPTPEQPAEPAPEAPTGPELPVAPPSEGAPMAEPAKPKAPDDTLSIPQPRPNRRGEKRGRITPEERAGAESAYADLIHQAEEKQREIAPKYSHVPRRVRPSVIRTSEEMRPILEELNRVKDILAQEVRGPKPSRPEVAPVVATAGALPAPEQPAAPVSPDQPTYPWETSMREAERIGLELVEKRAGGASAEEVARLEEEFVRQANIATAADTTYTGVRPEGGVRPIQQLVEAASVLGITSERVREINAKVAEGKRAKTVPGAEPVIPAGTFAAPETEPSLTASRGPLPEGGLPPELAPQGEAIRRTLETAAAGAPAGLAEDLRAGAETIPPASVSAPESPTTPPSAETGTGRHRTLLERARDAARAERGMPLTSGGPETTPPGPEARERERSGERTPLEAARSKYATVLSGQRKWFGHPGKGELAAAQQAYEAAIADELRRELTALGAEHVDATNDPKHAKELGRQYADVYLRYNIGEAEKFRQEFATPEKNGFIQKAQVWMKQHAKTRFVASLGLLGVAGVGTLTGQLYMTAGAAAVRGILTGVGTASTIEAGMRSKGRGLMGGARKYSKEQVDAISDVATLERAIAAHTLDQVEYGEKTFGRRETVRTKGIIRKRAVGTNVDLSGQLLVERLGVVLREQKERQIAEAVMSGESKEGLMLSVVEDLLQHQTLKHKELVDRIGKNKRNSAILGVSAVTLGGLAGHFAAEGTTHFNLDPRTWFHAKMGAGHGAPGAGSGTPVEAITQQPAAVDTLGHTSAAADTVQHTMAGADTLSHVTGAAHIGAEQAGSVVSTGVETAHHGDSVWSMAGRFVDRSLPQLSAEQRTWVIDSLKDQIMKDPSQFGLHGVDQLNVGDHIDFSKIGDIRSLGEKAAALSKETLSSIHQHNIELADWQHAHPQEMVTSVRAEDVLHHAAASSSSEAVSAASGAIPIVPDHAPMSEYYVTGPDGQPHFQMPEVTPDSSHVVVPEVTSAVATPASEAAAHVPNAIELGQATEPMKSLYRAYQSDWIRLPDAVQNQFDGGLAGMTVEQAARTNAVETMIGKSSGLFGSVDRAEMAKTMKSIATSLLEAGYKGTDSLKQGLAWLMNHRQ